MKTPPNELRRARLPGAILRTRRALSAAWRRSREPTARGAAQTPDRTAWAFLAWIAVVCVGYALARLLP